MARCILGYSRALAASIALEVLGDVLVKVAKEGRETINGGFSGVRAYMYLFFYINIVLCGSFILGSMCQILQPTSHEPSTLNEIIWATAIYRVRVATDSHVSSEWRQLRPQCFETLHLRSSVDRKVKGCYFKQTTPR